MIYQDAEGPRAQLYAYSQSVYFIFSETKYKTGSALDQLIVNGSLFQPGVNNQYGWNTWYSAIDTAISALLESEDRGIIYGDILNCYGAELMFALPSIPADYIVTPVYNAEVLTQFENLTVTSNRPLALIQRDTSSSLVNRAGLSMNVNFVAKSMANGNVGLCPNRGILNFHIAGQPSNDIIIIATRAMTLNVSKTRCCDTASNKIGQPRSCYYPSAVGTELIVRLTMSWKNATQYEIGVVSTNGAEDSGNLSALRLMAFDWHPALYQVGLDAQYPDDGYPTASTPSSPTSVSNAYLDYDNYTIVEPSMLQKLHEMALYSEFGVPHI